ncbi:MAG: SCO family protein [Paracoccaceae bacterium]
MGQNRLFIAAGAGLAAVGASLGLWAMVFGGAGGLFEKCGTGAIAGGAGSIGGAFTLTDHTGMAVTDSDVFSRPGLVYFGYTFCPDVCPLDVARNADAVDLLTKRGLDIRPVFITIDPERDTPEVLAEYVGYMHQNMLGLTGTLDQIKAASQIYRTYYKKQETGDEYYLMDHSTFSYLVLPGVGFVNFFKNDESPEHVADTAACFLQEIG